MFHFAKGFRILSINHLTVITFMKILKKILAPLLLFFAFSACKKDGFETGVMDIAVNHYQNVSLGWEGEGFPHQNFVVQQGKDIGTNNWKNAGYGYIEGFDFEPGYIYNLTIVVSKVKNPPADGSSLKQQLVKVNSKIKATDEATFEIALKVAGQNLIRGDANTGFVIANHDLICNNLCNDLTQALASNLTTVKGKFTHGANGSYVLKEIIKN